MATDNGKCFARIDDRELSEETRAKVLSSKRRYDAAFRKQIKRGIEDGSIVACDAKLAAFAIAGALNGIADWHNPEGVLSVETIADEFALRLTEGFAARRAPARKAESAKRNRKSRSARPG